MKVPPTEQPVRNRVSSGHPNYKNSRQNFNNVKSFVSSNCSNDELEVIYQRMQDSHVR